MQPSFKHLHKLVWCVAFLSRYNTHTYMPSRKHIHVQVFLPKIGNPWQIDACRPLNFYWGHIRRCGTGLLKGVETTPKQFHHWKSTPRSGLLWAAQLVSVPSAIVCCLHGLPASEAASSVRRSLFISQVLFWKRDLNQRKLGCHPWYISQYVFIILFKDLLWVMCVCMGEGHTLAKASIWSEPPCPSQNLLPKQIIPQSWSTQEG